MLNKDALRRYTRKTLRTIADFFRRHWIGVILITVATLVFFWPLLPRLSTYILPGDAMFNAWTLSRNHSCILMQGCPDYTDGNIFFPNQDSMLYSETQLSAGLLTLPLHFINDNPVFSYNVWTILSIFFSGLFMYLLAKRISRGNEVFSVAAGLVFAFAPYKIIATGHLQNLSIFWLPLIILLIINYIQKPKKITLVGLFAASLAMFYASWYQMAFALVALVIVLAGIGLFKMAPWRRIGWASMTVGLAIAATLPLALAYVQFSEQSGANYTLAEQTLYSSSLADYAIPSSHTLAGELARQIEPELQGRESFNGDGVSYHGFTLYLVGLSILVLGLIYRKRDVIWRYIHRWSVIAGSITAAGFVISLGPLLKIADKTTYPLTINGQTLDLAFPMPYMLVNVLLPQLNFIRAIGRSTVLVLLGLCIMLALLPLVLAKLRKDWQKVVVGVLVLAGIFFELMPAKLAHVDANKYMNSMSAPAVYSFIRDDPRIDNILILASDTTFPDWSEPKHKIPRLTSSEQVMWAGYHNKNIFNGYSGYFPPGYNESVEDFIDFKPDDVNKMKKLGLKYILVDKLLSSSNPELDERVADASGNKVYEDNRFLLVKIQ